MRNNSIYWFIGLLFTSGIVCILLFGNKRKEGLSFAQTLDQAGKPDQIEHSKQEIDQLENAKMVSEGSQFGVQYYNKTAKAEQEELKNNK